MTLHVVNSFGCAIYFIEFSEEKDSFAKFNGSFFCFGRILISAHFILCVARGVFIVFQNTLPALIYHLSQWQTIIIIIMEVNIDELLKTKSPHVPHTRSRRQVFNKMWWYVLSLSFGLLWMSLCIYLIRHQSNLAAIFGHVRTHTHPRAHITDSPHFYLSWHVNIIGDGESIHLSYCLPKTIVEMLSTVPVCVRCKRRLTSTHTHTHSRARACFCLLQIT